MVIGFMSQNDVDAIQLHQINLFFFTRIQSKFDCIINNLGKKLLYPLATAKFIYDRLADGLEQRTRSPFVELLDRFMPFSVDFIDPFSDFL